MATSRWTEPGAQPQPATKQNVLEQATVTADQLQQNWQQQSGSNAPGTTQTWEAQTGPSLAQSSEQPTWQSQSNGEEKPKQQEPVWPQESPQTIWPSPSATATGSTAAASVPSQQNAFAPTSLNAAASGWTNSTTVASSATEVKSNGEL